MNKTVINIKTDRKLKSKAQKIAAELGLPLGTILNSYLRRLVAERRVVFSAPLKLNPTAQRRLQKILQDVKEGKNVTGPFTVGEAIRHLRSL